MSVFHAFTATGTVSVSTNTTSASSALTPGATGEIVRVTNGGTQLCFVNLGTSAVTVTAATGVALPGSASIYLARNDGDTYVAAITPTGTTTIYAAVGNGNGVAG